MSLVDYTSSSDDDVSEDREQEEEEEEEQGEAKPQNEPQVSNHRASSPTNPHDNQRSGTLESVPNASTASCIEKLPDASLLLNSPTVSLLSGTDHASRVAFAMAGSASRKRDSNGLSPNLPRTKVPKGTLPHTKSFPDTVGGILVPPQLTGRSNIVTEDIGKLFVRRHAESSSQ